MSLRDSPSSRPGPNLNVIDRVAFGLCARAAAQRGLAWLAPSAAVGVGLGVSDQRTAALLTATAPLLLGFGAGLRRVPQARGQAAKALDQTHSLSGLCETALGLLQKPGPLRPFEQACVRQAADRLASVSAKGIASFAGLSTGLFLGCLCVAMLALLLPRFAVPKPDGAGLLSAVEGSSPSSEPMRDSVAAELERVAAALGEDPEAAALRLKLQTLATATRRGDHDALHVADALTPLRQQAQQLSRHGDAAVSLLAGELRSTPQLSALGDAVTEGSPQAIAQAAQGLLQHIEGADQRKLDQLRKQLTRLGRTLANRSSTPSLLRRAPRQAAGAPNDTDLNDVQRKLARLEAALAARGEGVEQAMHELQRSLETLAQHARDAAAAQQAARNLDQLRERLRRGDTDPSPGTAPGERPVPGAGQQANQAANPEQEAIEAFLRRAGGGEPGKPGDAKGLGGSASGPRLSPGAGSSAAPGRDPTAPTPGATVTASATQGPHSRVRGLETEGPSRSQVIAEVVAGGVATRGYARVHADYQAHAEDQLEQKPLSTSDRYLVRRYFTLIEPQ